MSTVEYCLWISLFSTPQKDHSTWTLHEAIQRLECRFNQLLVILYAILEFPPLDATQKFPPFGFPRTCSLETMTPSMGCSTRLQTTLIERVQIPVPWVQNQRHWLNFALDGLFKNLRRSGLICLVVQIEQIVTKF